MIVIMMSGVHWVPVVSPPPAAAPVHLVWVGRKAPRRMAHTSPVILIRGVARVAKHFDLFQILLSEMADIRHVFLCAENNLVCLLFIILLDSCY